MLNTPDKIRKFYGNNYAKYGATPVGMAWADDQTHYKRLRTIHNIVTNVCYIPLKRVLDVGCGIGLVPRIWGLWRRDDTTYHGIDLVQEYIDTARLTFIKSSNIVFNCKNYMEYESPEPYDITLAIGTIAWQPLDTALDLLSKMWKDAAPGGVMVFTYLPDQPLPSPTVRWMKKELGATQHLYYQGYASSNEIIAVFKKGDV